MIEDMANVGIMAVPTGYIGSFVRLFMAIYWTIKTFIIHAEMLHVFDPHI